MLFFYKYINCNLTIGVNYKKNLSLPAKFFSLLENTGNKPDLKIIIYETPGLVESFIRFNKFIVAQGCILVELEKLLPKEENWISVLDFFNNKVLAFCSKEHIQRATLSGLAIFCLKKYFQKSNFFIHGSAIMLKNRLILLIGKSGRGKTTISYKAAYNGFKVLSDEMVLIDYRENTFFAQGTPFGKISDGPLLGEIDCIMILKQSSENCFKSISAVQAFSYAWSDSYYRGRKISLQRKKEVFNNMFNLFSTKKCYEMEFRNDFDQWDELIELCDKQ